MRSTAVRTCVPALLVLFMVGCGGGARVLDEPVPVTTVSPVAQTVTEHSTVTLDWVVVRDGPGTWASNADWDEYHLTVANHADTPLRVLRVDVFDSMGSRVRPERERKALTAESRRTVRRYKSADVAVEAGANPDALIVAGGASLVAGSALYAYGLGSAVFSLGTASGTGMMAAGTGMALVAAPALMVGGVVKAVRLKEVNGEIDARAATFPIEIAPGQTEALAVFFPLAPSPDAVVLQVVEDDELKDIALDTSAALDGLHLHKD